ncbi:MAG: hypothetical protein ACKOOL_06590 [Novosphingobium sp.]
MYVPEAASKEIEGPSARAPMLTDFMTKVEGVAIGSFEIWPVKVDVAVIACADWLLVKGKVSGGGAGGGGGVELAPPPQAANGAAMIRAPKIRIIAAAMTCPHQFVR